MPPPPPVNTPLSMPGDLCIACGSTRKNDQGASFHRFPVDECRRGVWLRVFQLQETQVKPHTRVWSRHFPGGDATRDPQLGLGKRFASPTKKSNSGTVWHSNRSLSTAPGTCISASVSVTTSLLLGPGSAIFGRP